MMICSILLKSYGALWMAAHPRLAVVCWLVGLLFDVFRIRRLTRGVAHPIRASLVDILAVNVGCLIAWLAIDWFYVEATMRWKDGLPLIAQMVALLMQAIQIPVAAFDGQLHITTMAGPLQFPVDLDHLGILPPLIVAGFSLVYLFLATARWSQVVKGVLLILYVLLAALLLRWVLATGMFLFFCDFVGYETEELPIAPFFKPGLTALLYVPFFLIGAVILHPRFVAWTSKDPLANRSVVPRHSWAWLVVLILMIAACWQPKGVKKDGTILINTYHTQWSRTDRAYDQAWYGAGSGYNYAGMKRLFEGFHNVREVQSRITSRDLDGASALVIYVPDQAFSEDERRAIMKFVERGGGLLLIGDHTNVFGSTSHLNELCRPFGFIFRDDVLFDLDEDFFQLFDAPAMSSRFLDGMSFFKFRGPASIQSTSWLTRTIFRVGHAKSLRAIYSVNNFYPPPHDNPKMRIGEFAVSVASRYGQGRVVAFADSTIFSNFEIFYPGKYEFLLNSMDWLNHADTPLSMPLKRCSGIGVFLLLTYLLWQARSPRRVLGTLLAYVLVAALSMMAGIRIEQARASLPLPARPMRFLFFAAEPADEAYRLRAFTTETPFEQRYDVFIQWVLRNDMFSGFYLCGPGNGNDLYESLDGAEQAEAGLAMIVSRPEHLDLLAKLASGPMGSTERLLLMIDSQLPWENVKSALIESQILVEESVVAEADASWPDGELRLADATRRIALVFSAERFSDRQMGFSEKVVPDEAQLARYQEEFELLDWLFERTN